MTRTGTADPAEECLPGIRLHVPQPGGGRRIRRAGRRRRRAQSAHRSGRQPDHRDDAPLRAARLHGPARPRGAGQRHHAAPAGHAAGAGGHGQQGPLVAVQVEAAGEEPGGGQAIPSRPAIRGISNTRCHTWIKTPRCCLRSGDTDGIPQPRPVQADPGRRGPTSRRGWPPRLSGRGHGHHGPGPAAGVGPGDRRLRPWPALVRARRRSQQPAGGQGPSPPPQPHTTYLPTSTRSSTSSPAGPLTPGKKFSAVRSKTADRRDLERRGRTSAPAAAGSREIVTPEQLRGHSGSPRAGAAAALRSHPPRGGRNPRPLEPPRLRHPGGRQRRRSAGQRRKAGPAPPPAAGQPAAAKPPDAKPADAEPGDDDDEKGESTPERAKALRAHLTRRSGPCRTAAERPSRCWVWPRPSRRSARSWSNNRIDTEELILRVKGGIADPLRRGGQRDVSRAGSAAWTACGWLGDAPAGHVRPQCRPAARLTPFFIAMRQSARTACWSWRISTRPSSCSASIVQMQEKTQRGNPSREHKQKLKDLAGRIAMVHARRHNPAAWALLGLAVAGDGWGVVAGRRVRPRRRNRKRTSRPLRSRPPRRPRRTRKRPAAGRRPPIRCRLSSSRSPSTTNTWKRSCCGWPSLSSRHRPPPGRDAPQRP